VRQRAELEGKMALHAKELDANQEHWVTMQAQVRLKESERERGGGWWAHTGGGNASTCSHPRCNQVVP
jgi:plasmid maintenance system antidote protein VapI